MPAETPQTMRALRLHEYSENPERLRLEEVPVPSPADGEVLVRVSASPINPSDVMFTRGLYGFTKGTPTIPGFECSGTVVSTGNGLFGKWLVGKRVACSVQQDHDGMWAEYAVADQSMCVPLLDDLDDEQGATLLVNPTTALALLDLAKAGGHRAAVHTAAAGQLGRILLKLAKRDRYPVIHVVRRTEQVALLEGLGAEHVLNSSDEDFDRRLHDLSKKLKATICLDAVAGESTGRVLAAMPRGSRAAVYGALSEAPVQVDPGQFIFGGKSVEGFWLSQWFKENNPLKVLLRLRRLQKFLARDKPVGIAERVGLEEVPEALARYMESMTRGKVLVVPGKS